METATEYVCTNESRSNQPISITVLTVNISKLFQITSCGSVTRYQ